MKLDKIQPIKDDRINVIIETPKCCRNKYDYNEDLKLFCLKKTLPMGMMFPFDFGFIPNTQAEDGDPVDVLVIMEEAAYPGCLVECRLIGAIEAIQTEKNGKTTRNDRLVAVSDASIVFCELNNIGDLGKKVLHQIENFFVFYNREEHKEFKIEKWADADKAFKLIKKAMK